MWDPGLDSGTETECKWKTGEIQIESTVQLKVFHFTKVNFLVLTRYQDGQNGDPGKTK